MFAIDMKRALETGKEKEAEGNNKENEGAKEGGGKKRKSKRKTSAVWDVFAEVEGKEEVKCKLCGITYAHPPGNGTGTMISHINQKHSDVNVVHPLKKISDVEIMERLGRLMVEYGLPFAILDDPNLEELIKRRPSTYKKVSRDQMKRFFHQKVQDVQQIIKEEIDTAASVSLINDGWTSEAENSYYCEILQYLDRDMNIRTPTIQFSNMDCPHTGKNIKTVLEQGLANVGIGTDRVQAYVSDNAADVQCAGRLMGMGPEKDRDNRILPCSAHTVNLSAHAATQKKLIVAEKKVVSKVQRIVKKTRKIASHFHVSRNDKEQLKNIQFRLIEDEKRRAASTSESTSGSCSSSAGAKTSESIRKEYKEKKRVIKVLKRFCPARWVSLYNTWESILYNKAALQVFASNNLSSKYRLSADEWIILELLTPLLKEVADMLTAVQSSTEPTLPLVIPFINLIRDVFGKFKKDNIDQSNNHFSEYVKEVISEFHQQFMKDFDARWQEFDKSLYLSTLLDPTLKGNLTEAEHHYLRDEYIKLKQTLPDIASDYRPSRPQISLRDRLSGKSKSTQLETESEIDQYLQLPHVQGTVNCLQWWKDHQDKYPVLFQLARRYLAIPASSVSAERSFSIAKHLVNSTNSQLTKEVANNIVYLALNIQYWEIKKIV